MPGFLPREPTHFRTLPRDAAQEHSILFGPLGLRAGWGVLLFFVLTLLLGFGLFYLLAGGTRTLGPIQAEMRAANVAAAHARATGIPAVPEPQRFRLSAVPELSQTGAVLLAALALSFVERRRFAVYGLPKRGIANLLQGALWGLAAISALVGLLRGLHLLVFDRQLLHGGAIAPPALTWLLFFLLVGMYEEYLFRGYIQFTLMRGVLGLARRLAPARERLVAFWLAALFLSALFFVVHGNNSGETPAGLAGVFLAGLLFSYALWRTGSLWWGIGFHMTWDWGQSFLFGVPDSGILTGNRLFVTHAAGRALLSGGVDGPEGSLLMIPVLLLIFAVLRLHTFAEQPPVEPLPGRGRNFGEHRLESESA